MTTVGYGDKAPKSVPGRLVTIFWMIIGMIFFSILTGTMTGVLFVTDQPKEVTMFGKKVAVLAESEEVEIAMTQSAYVDEYDTVADILEAARNEINFVLLDRFVVNAYLEKFSNHNFKVTKLIDTDSSSYFYLVLSREKEFFKNVRNCLEKHKIVADKAIRKMLMTVSNEWSKIKNDESDTDIMDNHVIIVLAGAFAFLLCLGIIWQYLYLRNTVKDTEVIELEVKKADPNSTYVNRTKEEGFIKCLSCRQCKNCNDQIE